MFKHRNEQILSIIHVCERRSLKGVERATTVDVGRLKSASGCVICYQAKVPLLDQNNDKSMLVRNFAVRPS